MDIQTIKDEILTFNNNYFYNIVSITSDYSNFIDKNNLYYPKEDYTILFYYLNSLLNHFKNIDPSIETTLLAKVHRDVEYINRIYLELKEKTADIENIFSKHFTHKSKVLNTLEKEINQYNNIKNISYENKKILKNYVTHYESLKAIYFTNFKEIFIDNRKYFLSLLLHILNSKIYYLDKLLWIQVSMSNLIMRNFKGLHKKNIINSQLYLKYKLTVILPYSKDYEYLQKCLRIFK